MTQALAEALYTARAETLLKRRFRFDGITAIIPCYNEVESVTETVRQVSQSVRRTGLPHEVIVVDDGSTDASVEELELASGEFDVKIIRNTRNRGYGYSLKRAITASQYEVVAITDADGTYPNERLAELVELMAEADMVVGARTGTDVNVPFIRRPAKWALRKLASYLASTDIPDLNSGLRVIRKDLVKKFISLLPDGFSFTTTITLALLTHDYDVRYVPIDYARRTGRSTIRPIRDTMNFLSLIVRTVMYFKPLKIFAPASACLFGFAIGLALVTKLVFGQLADVTSVTLAMASVQLLAIGLLADLIDKRSAMSS
jgi:glycosyltransferase involved in cell wall biosynthesis